MTIKELVEIFKKYQLPENLYILWENEPGKVFPICIECIVEEPVKDNEKLYANRINFVINTEKTIASIKEIYFDYSCPENVKKDLVEWIINRFGKNPVAVKAIYCSSYTMDLVVSITSDLKAKTIKEILDSVDKWVQFEFVISLCNKVLKKDKKGDSINIYTDYISGIGINKKPVIINELKINPGEAVVISSVFFTDYTNVPKEHYCDFSLSWGWFDLLRPLKCSQNLFKALYMKGDNQ